MASRTGIHISGHYVVSIIATSFYICTVNSRKLKGRIELYFILILKLSDHQTGCFNFGLVVRRIHPNGCKFESN